jgi:Ca-activated chloride channel family protein
MIRILSIVALMIVALVFGILGPGRESVARLALSAGLPRLAAAVSGDARLGGYALLKAGDYAGAAKILAERHDAVSAYNYAEALARGGDVPGAIGAYEAVLDSHM